MYQCFCVGAILNGKVFDNNNSQFIHKAQLRYQLVLPSSRTKKNTCKGEKRQGIKPKKNDEAQMGWGPYCTLDGLQPLRVLCDVTLSNHSMKPSILQRHLKSHQKTTLRRLMSHIYIYIYIYMYIYIWSTHS